jgi:hypothetical protein
MTDEITHANDEMPVLNWEDFDRQDKDEPVQTKDRLLAEPVTDWDHKISERYDGRGGP